MSLSLKNARLADAVRRGDVTTVAALLTDKRVNPNYRRADGKTVLELALQHNNTAIAQMVLDAGAVPKIMDTTANRAHGKEIWDILQRVRQQKPVKRTAKRHAAKNIKIPRRLAALLP